MEARELKWGVLVFKFGMWNKKEKWIRVAIAKVNGRPNFVGFRVGEMEKYFMGWGNELK